MYKLFSILLISCSAFSATAQMTGDLKDSVQTAKKVSEQMGLLKEKMVKEKAPSFILKDIDGKIVKLEDYKGKTVVLDFWATWCAPCKAVFPIMQATIDRYETDADVKFLFIHTLERGSNAVELVKNYLKDNPQYRFHILMDLKDRSTNENAVTKAYKVTGIPVKVVIDKNGLIRFVMRGSGAHSDVFGETAKLSAMIELAKNN